jgi:hypothetical protein
MGKMRLAATVIASVCVLSLAAQRIFFPPARVDFDSHLICAVDGAAYVASAHDGVSEEKTLTRARNLDKSCSREPQ